MLCANAKETIGMLGLVRTHEEYIIVHWHPLLSCTGRFSNQWSSAGLESLLVLSVDVSGFSCLMSAGTVCGAGSNHHDASMFVPSFSILLLCTVTFCEGCMWWVALGFEAERCLVRDMGSGHILSISR